MKKILFIAPALLALTACTNFLAPYQITFSTIAEDSINPAEDTLNLVINSPALAYVSGYKCDEGEEVTLLPVLTDDMVENNLHSLSLGFLSEQVSGSRCDINVTALDRSTTSTSTATISLYMYSKEEPAAAEGKRCAGIIGIQCREGLECKLAGDYPDAGGVCVKKSDELNEKLQDELEEAAEPSSEETAVEAEAETEVSNAEENSSSNSEESSNSETPIE